MKNQNKLFSIFIVAVLFLAVWPLFQCQQNKLSQYHNFVLSEEFNSLTRQEQILKCANCHRQEFDNEIKGPHSFAYKSISAHKEFVNSKQYDCDFYTQHVNRSYDHCMGCHTPKNLYETLLTDSGQTPSEFIKSILNIKHPRPIVRDAKTQSTGIDCMSCHFDGRKMVSLKHVPSKIDSIVKEQTLEVITTNNLNCYLCHADAVRNFNPSMSIKLTGSALCINCHQEYSPSDKGTHYFYWQHDPADKLNPKPTKLLDDFKFALSESKREGVITWTNTQIPHKISPGPEMILFCEILAKDSTPLGNTTIRINKKREFDEEMYKTLGNNKQRGIEGDDIPLDGQAIKYYFPIKNPTAAKYFKVSFTHKSQYWFPDSSGKVTLVKIYPCN